MHWLRNSEYYRKQLLIKIFTVWMATTLKGLELLNPHLESALHPLYNWILEKCGTYWKYIFLTYVFIISPQGLMTGLNFFPILPKFCIIFILSPTSVLLCLFCFLFYLITEFELKIYGIFSPWSHSHFNNILRIFDGWANFPFAIISSVIIRSVIITDKLV